MGELISYLRKLRQARRLDRQDLADAIGIHVNSLGDWERRQSVPRLDSFIAWAQTLGYNVTLTPLDPTP